MTEDKQLLWSPGRLSCVNQELVRKQLVKEAVIKVPPVYADATLLAKNKLWLEHLTSPSRQYHYTFIQTPNLQGTNA